MSPGHRRHDIPRLAACSGPAAGRLGLSMVEATVASVVVGLLLVAAVSVAGRAARVGALTADRTAAGLLADALMAEILLQPYLDPGPGPVFGPEAGEDTSTRRDFDDVDDYHGWTASPPQNKAGAVFSDLAGWEESVTVVWCAPGNPEAVSPTDQGVKRITVTVRRQGAVLATLTALRTAAFSVLTRPPPAGPTGNNPPTAAFSWLSLADPGGLRVRFDASASGDADGADAGTLAFFWDFGDGSVAGGRIVEHTYADEGAYAVTLTVADGRGGLATAAQTIEVRR